MSTDIKSLGSFVWSIAELLRGDFKQSEYGKVILPFIVLRRLDCILDETKSAVLDMASSLPADMDDEARQRFIIALALKLADTHVVGPIDFTRLIWVTALGSIFFDELPDLFVWIGGAMILGSTAYIAYREHMLGRKRGLVAGPPGGVRNTVTSGVDVDVDDTAAPAAEPGKTSDKGT